MCRKPRPCHIVGCPKKLGVLLGDVRGASEWYSFFLSPPFPRIFLFRLTALTSLQATPYLTKKIHKLLSRWQKQMFKSVEEWKTNLMSLAILFHLLCAQHVSDINISIFRSLRLCWWITTSIVLFSVRCVLEFLLQLIFGGFRFAGWSTSAAADIWWCSFCRLKH